MSDAVLQKRLAWALFVLLLSTLVCYQPTELIFGLISKFYTLQDNPTPVFAGSLDYSAPIVDVGFHEAGERYDEVKT